MMKSTTTTERISLKDNHAMTDTQGFAQVAAFANGYRITDNGEYSRVIDENGNIVEVFEGDSLRKALIYCFQLFEDDTTV